VAGPQFPVNPPKVWVESTLAVTVPTYWLPCFTRIPSARSVPLREPLPSTPKSSLASYSFFSETRIRPPAPAAWVAVTVTVTVAVAHAGVGVDVSHTR
jgi:hypothetical protein